MRMKLLLVGPFSYADRPVSRTEGSGEERSVKMTAT
jgi:hypothetical protein